MEEVSPRDAIIVIYARPAKEVQLVITGLVLTGFGVFMDWIAYQFIVSVLTQHLPRAALLLVFLWGCFFGYGGTAGIYYGLNAVAAGLMPDDLMFVKIDETGFAARAGFMVRRIEWPWILKLEAQQKVGGRYGHPARVLVRYKNPNTGKEKKFYVNDLYMIRYGELASILQAGWANIVPRQAASPCRAVSRGNEIA